MIDFARFVSRIYHYFQLLWLVSKLYWKNANAIYYTALSVLGIPQVSIIVGQGRDAWHVSEFMMEMAERKMINLKDEEEEEHQS